MSVVVKCIQSGKVFAFAKGADSSILMMLDHSEEFDKVNE